MTTIEAAQLIAGFRQIPEAGFDAVGAEPVTAAMDTTRPNGAVVLAKALIPMVENRSRAVLVVDSRGRVSLWIVRQNPFWNLPA